MAEAETVAEAVTEAVETTVVDKDTQGHHGCCGGNKVNVDILFDVNLGGKSIGTEEEGEKTSTGE